jgi:tetratricopeptide (TPR) repeat protein
MRIMVYIRRFRICLLIVGGLCLSYGIYQKCWYSDPLEKALKSIEANRLDQQYLETAKDSLFSLKALILYNMGVRAYHANNIKNASRHFYDVIDENRDHPVKKNAYYNLGNILVQLELPRRAAEMYQESLRLDPGDWESKYNLERLYVFHSMAFPDEKGQASLEQEPGDEGDDKAQKGQSGPERPDI